MVAKSGVEIDLSAVDHASGALGRVSAALGSVAKAAVPVRALAGAFGFVTGAAGALAASIQGLAAAATVGLTRNVIAVASQFEDYAAVLETTERSSKKAQKALDWVAQFATKTPYEVAEVTEAFVKMRAYGLEPTNGLLETLGNTASAMGKPLMQAVEAIADAVTGENERLKEFGIKAAKKGGEIAYTYTDEAGKQRKKTVDANNRAMIQSTLSAIFNAKYKGAMEKRSQTWSGMQSNMADMWTSFERMIAASGVFDFAKSRMKSLMDLFFKLNESGELRQIAEKIGGMLTRAMEAAEGMALRFWGALKRWADPMGTAKTDADAVCLVIEKMQTKITETVTSLNDFVESVGGWKAILIAFGTVITASVVAPLATLVVALGPVGVAVTGFAALAGYLLMEWSNAAGGLSKVWDQIVGDWDRFTTALGDVGRALGIMSGPIRQPFGAMQAATPTIGSTDTPAGPSQLARGVRGRAGSAPSAASAAGKAGESKSWVSLDLNLKAEDGTKARVGKAAVRGKGVELNVDNGLGMAW